MTDSYFVVAGPTAEKWFPDGNLDAVRDAVFTFMATKPDLFQPNGDVNLDKAEMGDLILARQDIGLEGVPEELFVGIVPRQLGTITRKDTAAPSEIKNSIIVGTAGEISLVVLGAFRSYYAFADANAPKKTAKDRADDRKKKRKLEKRNAKKR